MLRLVTEQTVSCFVWALAQNAQTVRIAQASQCSSLSVAQKQPLFKLLKLLKYCISVFRLLSLSSVCHCVCTLAQAAQTAQTAQAFQKEAVWESHAQARFEFGSVAKHRAKLSPQCCQGGTREGLIRMFIIMTTTCLLCSSLSQQGY